MNTLKQIDSVLYYLDNSESRTLMRCYIYRRVLNWTPKEVSERFGYSPVTVNAYAQRAAILFDLKHSNESKEGKVLEACQNFVRRAKLKQHRNEADRVSKRITNRLKAEA